MLIKIDLSWQIFEKYSNTKFHENPSNGSRVIPCARTDRRIDRHDGANSRFSQFCEKRLQKLRQRHTNCQPSNYKSANLTRRPRRSVGCKAQSRVIRNTENFPADSVCNFWVWGNRAWSFCFLRKSLFKQSLKRTWEGYSVQFTCQENQPADERDTVRRLRCYITENN